MALGHRRFSALRSSGRYWGQSGHDLLDVSTSQIDPISDIVGCVDIDFKRHTTLPLSAGRYPGSIETDSQRSAVLLPWVLSRQFQQPPTVHRQPPFIEVGHAEQQSLLPGHSVSANASDTEPAKLLAVFVVDTNETELTTPLGN
jgi:hypothetical protein